MSSNENGEDFSDSTKSVFNSYSCEDLIKTANNPDFSLRNLAALRAMSRCKDFTFDTGKLSDFERKLYANEIPAADGASADSKNVENLTPQQLIAAIKNEKNASQKLKLYKQLRLKLKKNSSQRQDYLKSTNLMYKWALQNYKKNIKSTDSYAVLYEAAQVAARTHWTEDNATQALKIIKNSIGVLSPKNSVAELHFLRGRIFEESQNSIEALKQYTLTLKDIETFKPKTTSFNKDRILWLKAWVLYKDKNYIEAEKSFSELAGTTPDLSEKSRALFYQARCLKYLNQAPAAQQILETIPQNDFFSYYSLVAQHELGKKFPALTNIKSPNVLKIDLKLNFIKNLDEKNIFIDLAEFREFSLCEKYISLMSKTKEDESNLSLYLAKYNQFYMPLFKVFAKLNNDEKIDIFIKFPNLIFPRPYQNNVNDMAAKTKLSSSLIYSIMKQESAFNEKARSGAEAMGLMQVIPKLARQLSKKFNVPYAKPQDLYKPQINIQIGSFELMEQVQKQNGQLTFVAAAYNAGPGALANWLKNRKRADILEFIEEIPYDETRTYVKLIARNKLFYERVSNRDSEQDFPKDFLNQIN